MKPLFKDSSSTPKNYGVSSWWAGSFGDTYSDKFLSEKEKSTNNLYKMAAHRRAISNFVNIVTGKNVPVKFRVKGESFTNGKTVVLSSNIGEPKDFDSSVGLALHEGSHIVLSNFDLLRQLRSHCSRIVGWEKLSELEVLADNRKVNFLKTIKDILNYIEDRRIDQYIYTQAPGYRGYYKAMYDKYFNHPLIEKALISTKYTNETINSYMFRLINLHSKSARITALKALPKIYKTIDFSNINRLKTSEEALAVALDVFEIILKALPDPTVPKPAPKPKMEGQQKQSKESEKSKQNDDSEETDESNGSEGSEETNDETEKTDTENNGSNGSEETDEETEETKGSKGSEETEDEADETEESNGSEENESEETESSNGSEENESDETEETEENNSNGSEESETEETNDSEETEENESAETNDSEETESSKGSEETDDNSEENESKGSEENDSEENESDDDSISGSEETDGDEEGFGGNDYRSDAPTNNGGESNVDLGDEVDTEFADSDEELDQTGGFTPAQIAQLDKLLEKQKEFMDGETKKNVVSKDENKSLDAIEESGTDLKVVGTEFETSSGYRIKGIDCVVVNKMTESLMLDESFPLTTRKYNHTIKGYELDSRYMDEVNAGIIMGTQLGKKLQTRSESRDTVYNRQLVGRLDKRMISSLGFGNEHVFFTKETDKYKKANLHISIDASGSMDGVKWRKTITNVVALAKAVDMISNLEIQITFRTTSKDLPYIVTAYDSRVDKFTKIKKYFQYLEPNNFTPDGLCFEAILKTMVASGTDIDSYFLNISDGSPYFTNNGINYTGSSAIKHTRKMVDKISNMGIRVLSYYVSDRDNDANSWVVSQFKEAYGQAASFINITNVVEISRTMNKLFMAK